jgi:hypothetical protein
MLERRAAIEAEAGHSNYRKLDREHLSLFAGRVVARGVVDRCHGAVWEGLRVEPGGSLRCAVIPKTNHVLGHRVSPFVRQRATPLGYNETATRDSTAGLNDALQHEARFAWAGISGSVLKAWAPCGNPALDGRDHEPVASTVVNGLKKGQLCLLTIRNGLIFCTILIK